MTRGSDPKSCAVLISGRGSNLGALIKASSRPDYPAKIILVISNRPDAPGLALAREALIETAVIDHTEFPSRAAFDEALSEKLQAQAIDYILLAGFMRILSPEFIDQWQGRVLNIHPSLLPAYRGLNTHQRALEAGENLHGCSVHFVSPGLDEGPLIAKAELAVDPTWDEATLSRAVLALEHRLYPLVLELLAGERISTAINTPHPVYIDEKPGPLIFKAGEPIKL